MWRTGTFIASATRLPSACCEKGVPIQTVSVLLELNGEDSRILADVGTVARTVFRSTLLESHSAIESWFWVMASRSSHFGLGSPNSKRKNCAFLSTTFTKPLNCGKRGSLPVQMQVTLQCHQVQADVLNRVCQHAARRLSAFVELLAESDRTTAIVFATSTRKNCGNTSNAKGRTA